MGCHSIAEHRMHTYVLRTCASYIDVCEWWLGVCHYCSSWHTILWHRAAICIWWPASHFHPMRLRHALTQRTNSEACMQWGHDFRQDYTCASHTLCDVHLAEVSTTVLLHGSVHGCTKYCTAVLYFLHILSLPRFGIKTSMVANAVSCDAGACMCSASDSRTCQSWR